MIRLRVYATDGRWSPTALTRANLTPRQAWQWMRRHPGWQWVVRRDWTKEWRRL